MTYRSFWIEKFSFADSDLSQATTIYRHDGDIDLTVFELADWAKRNNVRCTWVDSCWLRVEVTAGLLDEFLSEYLTTDPRWSPPKPDLGFGYILVAEEF